MCRGPTCVSEWVEGLYGIEEQHGVLYLVNNESSRSMDSKESGEWVKLDLGDVIICVDVRGTYTEVNM